MKNKEQCFLVLGVPVLGSKDCFPSRRSSAEKSAKFKNKFKCRLS